MHGDEVARPSPQAASSVRLAAPRPRPGFGRDPAIASKAGPRPASARTAGKMPWATSRSSSSRQLSFVGRRDERPRRRSRPPELTAIVQGRGAGRRRAPSSLLLSAVVEIPFELPALSRRRSRRRGPASAADLRAVREGLGREALVVDGEPGRRPNLGRNVCHCQGGVMDDRSPQARPRGRSGSRICPRSATGAWTVKPSAST